MPVAAPAPAPTPLLAAGAANVVLPWHTIVTGQSIDVAGFARAAGVRTPPTTRRADLRWPAAGIAVTVVAQLVIALVAGGDISIPLLVLGVLSGIGTCALGVLAGTGGGILRKLTAAFALMFGVVQLAAVAGGAFGALADDSSPIALVASIVAVVSGVVLAVSAAIAGFRR